MIGNTPINVSATAAPFPPLYNMSQPLPLEYSVSGWMYFVQPAARQTWHFIFRLTHTAPYSDCSYLGDRTLSAWVGPA